MTLDVASAFLLAFCGSSLLGCFALYLLRNEIAIGAMSGKTLTFALDRADDALLVFACMTAVMFVLSVPYIVYKEIARRSTPTALDKED